MEYTTHEVRISNKCSHKDKFERKMQQGVVLGDGRYPCLPYLLTAMRNPVVVIWLMNERTETGRHHYHQLDNT
ncbi:hypothetical protein J437_LFUL017150 [Ladona fulva]|uniref:Uncharacterized protein n=1 Tax=Ladona fulva TaxID=123851 RepID=A0A8K0P1S5_LADFU|nr:hypothetical protein J437_LFUL017150 [Ladona fulva]